MEGIEKLLRGVEGELTIQYFVATPQIISDMENRKPLSTWKISQGMQIDGPINAIEPNTDFQNFYPVVCTFVHANLSNSVTDLH